MTPGSDGPRLRLRARDPAWLLTLATAGLALVATATLVVSRVLVPAEPAVIDSAAWPWTERGVVVDPVGAGSPFRAGDLVVAMDGRPLATWVEDVVTPWSPARPALADVVRFDLVRDGAPLTLEVRLGTIPGERVASAPIGLVGFGAGAMLLALILVARRPRATALRILFVAVAANSVDLMAWELDLQPTDLALRSPYLVAFAAAAVFNLVFWSALVHLLSTYPVRSGLVIRRPWLVPTIYAAPLAALGLGVVVARLLPGGTLVWVDRLASVVGLVASAMVIALIGATLAGYRRTFGPRRRQVRAIAATLTLAAAATLGFVTLPIALLGQPLVPRNVVAILALPVLAAVALAVVRDRLFQVDLLARRRERIVAAREEERRRLRRDLHDGLGPTLAALGLKLDLAREQSRSDPAGVAPLLDELRSDLRGIVGQVRTIARELRPPTLDALGLVGAIRQAADGLADGGRGPGVTIEAPDDLPALPAAVEVAAYRIAVEALMNIGRHAEASAVTLRIAHDGDALEIEVSDDGRGIAPGAIGVGTRAMAERAAEVGGEMTVEPRRPRGTRVLARLPFGPSPGGAPRDRAGAPAEPR